MTLAFEAGAAGLEYSSVKKASTEVGDSFLLHLALSLLMFFSSFPFPKERVRLSATSNKADHIFQVRICFAFHPAHSANIF